MAHYNYFENHPKLRARFNWCDGETGTSAWVVEFRSDWQADDWKEVSSFQLTIDEIEVRVYNGHYNEFEA
jgi:hypothetical protein